MTVVFETVAAATGIGVGLLVARGLLEAILALTFGKR